MSTPAWLVAGDAYLSLINGVEDAYFIPRNLLARVAYQECSWRPEVISGAIKSPAGAVGMFQLLPKYFPGAGQSIVADANTAGQLLTNLYLRFKDWTLALAAYNWGGGNVHHEMVTVDGVGNVITLEDLPTETANYVRAVCADVPAATGVLLA